MAAGWLYEPVHADVRDAWWLHQIRCDVRTPYQHVQIADTKLGTTLFCDSNVQSAELGQLHFHEAECVPAMSLADRPTRALVIGCSEGTVPLILAEAGFDHVLVARSEDPRVVKEVHVTTYHVLWELVHVFLDSPAVLGEDAA